ncbi:MAG: hypothetical protein A2Z20_06850 [Bdellovibrionales bacterium RBG_16_40_8]|nr:MAG: hypothetical protein A2Z20_06850 [Bdellovibrionales bacterium RBG_16_40_8]
MPPRIFFFLFTVLAISLTILLSIRLDPQVFKNLVWPFLLFYLGLAYLRYFFFFSGILIDIATKYFSQGVIDKTLAELPKVSIIVPCYNEENSIYKVIQNLADIKYPNYEIVVVDDGSTDNTYINATSAAQSSLKVAVSVFRKTNGGKASALNYGFRHSTGNFILCVDADSKLSSDTLISAIQHFKNPRVGSVAGFVNIGNIQNILVAFQQLEYMIGLNYLRRAYSFLGIVPIVPGPIGMFRRAALQDVGAFTEDKNIFAEDAELSLRLVAAGWLTKSEENMVAYTEAPTKLDALLRQRYRWNRGTFQALYKTFESLVHSSRPAARFLGWHLLSEIFFIPLVNICLLLIFVIRLAMYGEGRLFTVWMGSILILELITAALVIIKHKHKIFWLVVMFVSRLSYDTFLFMWRFYSLFDEFLNIGMNWDKLERSHNEINKEVVI